MMRRVIIIIVALLLTSSLHSSFAQTNPQEEIVKQWLVRRDLRSLGNDPLGVAVLNALNQKRLMLGFKNLPEISLALLREARGLIKSGKTKDALALIHHATLLSPDLLQPHLEILSLTLRGKLFSIKPTATSFWEATQTSLHLIGAQPELWVRYLCNAWLYLGVVMGLTLIALLVIPLPKALRFRLHEWQHRLPPFLPKGLLPLGMLTLSIAAAIALTPWVLLPIALLLIWKYTRNLEKIMISILIIALYAGTWAFSTFSGYLQLMSGPALSMLKIADGLDTSEKVAQLEQTLKENPNQPLAKFALAYVAKMSGNLPRAKEMLQSLLVASKPMDKAYINLGNIFYMQKDHAQAIAHYQWALARNSRSALASYNLGKLYFIEADLEAGNKALKNARNFDSESFEIWEAQAKKYMESEFVPIDATLAWQDFSTALGELSPGSLPKSLSRNLLALLIVLIVVGLWNMLKPAALVALACQRCGTTSCSDCATAASQAQHCEQCYNVYVRKITIDSEFKVRKERQVRGFAWRSKWLTAIGTAALPGMTALYHQSDSAAGLQLALAIALLTPLLPLPWVPSEFYFPVFAAGWHIAYLGALVAFYLVSLIRMWR